MCSTVGKPAAGDPAQYADPLPQALVLTAIVIGFALACFGLALALSLQRANGGADGDVLNTAEPPPRADGGPGELP